MLREKTHGHMRKSHAFPKHKAMRESHALRVLLSHGRVFCDSRKVQKSVTQIIYLGPLPSANRIGCFLGNCRHLPGPAVPTALPVSSEIPPARLCKTAPDATFHNPSEQTASADCVRPVYAGPLTAPPFQNLAMQTVPAVSSRLANARQHQPPPSRSQPSNSLGCFLATRWCKTALQTASADFARPINARRPAVLTASADSSEISPGPFMQDSTRCHLS